jgi:Protein of unknown function (DUF2783).
MALLHSDLRFGSPDDIYEAIISLADGLDDRAAHTALAAFALLLANHIGDEQVVREAIAAVRQALKDYPEATGGLAAMTRPARFFRWAARSIRCARSLT